MPSCTRILNLKQTCSTIPEKIDSRMVTSLGATPSKTKKAIEKGTARTPVVERWQSCTGKPFMLEEFVKTKDGRQTRRRLRYPCCVCNSKTSWYCLECKEFFCVEVQEDSKNKKRKYSLLETVIPQKPDTPTLFQKSCYHVKHMEAWVAVCEQEK